MSHCWFVAWCRYEGTSQADIEAREGALAAKYNIATKYQTGCTESDTAGTITSFARSSATNVWEGSTDTFTVPADGLYVWL